MSNYKAFLVRILKNRLKHNSFIRLPDTKELYTYVDFNAIGDDFLTELQLAGALKFNWRNRLQIKLRVVKGNVSIVVSKNE